MSSTVSACVATALGIRGLNYSVSSACATSAHCIGLGYQQIAWGMQDIVLAGGGEEVHWGMAMLFDAMGALSSRNNGDPERASRPYDRQRDGFVIGGGGGALVLEALDSALARDAPILAELVGYGASSDGADMVAPSGDGAADCMRMTVCATTGMRPSAIRPARKASPSAGSSTASARAMKGPASGICFFAGMP